MIRVNKSQNKGNNNKKLKNSQISLKQNISAGILRRLHGVCCCWWWYGCWNYR